MKSSVSLFKIWILFIVILCCLTACSTTPPAGRYESSFEQGESNEFAPPSENSYTDPDLDVFVAYQPPFLPVRFVIDRNGIEVEGAVDILTPIGTFEIGAALPLNTSRNKEGIIVILRNQQSNTEQRFYLDGSDNFSAQINGNTIIDVNAANNTITIDVKEGDVIEIRSTAALPVCGTANPSVLSVGMEARVEIATNIREEAYIPNDEEQSNVLVTTDSGEIIKIIDGVDCAYNGYWWKVRTALGVEGWMKEATNNQVLLTPLDQSLPAVPVNPNTWKMVIDKGEGLNLLVGDIGISGQPIKITDPWGNPIEVMSGSKPEFGTGGFEVYQHGAGDYRIEFMDQVFTLPLDDQFTRINFIRQ